MVKMFTNQSTCTDGSVSDPLTFMQMRIQIWDSENVHMDPDPIVVLVRQICPHSSVGVSNPDL